MREILSFEGTTKVCKYKRGWQCHPPTPSYFTMRFDCLPHLNYTRCCITWSRPRLSRDRSRVSTVLFLVDFFFPTFLVFEIDKIIYNR